MEIIIGLVALLVGIAAGFFFGKGRASSEAAQLDAAAQSRAQQITAEADTRARDLTADAEARAQAIAEKAERRNEDIKQRKIKENKERVAKAREEANSIKREAEAAAKAREEEMRKLESNFQSQRDKIKSERSELTQLQADFEGERRGVEEERKAIQTQLSLVEERKQRLEAASEEHIRALETVAKLSESEAKEQILTAVRQKAETDALSIVRESLEEAKNSASKDARKIIIQTIQRQAAETTIENTVSVFKIDSDDIKGQIIGREGRNIRALEAATGAELVVDDTPEVIVISSFDPIRRELCRLSLKQLVADRRIQPSRIEEVVTKVRKELDGRIAEIGEQTIIKLDIHGLDPYLVKMVGRMRFRSSYGQNLLRHSIETANLCSTMAVELGLNRKHAQLAKRAGLLHDIGKVVEEETELSHALVGMEICKKHNESAAVCNAVGAHHDEIEMNNILSPIIQACDAISGSRPGARREILDSYLNRIGELETLALSHEGVERAFAMQAGRELRVIVEAERISDAEADDMSFRISQKIQDEMQYPGQIKVIVIREKRAVTFAR